VNQHRGQQRGLAPWTGLAIYSTVEEIPTGEEVLAGTFLLNDQPIIILFDFGASRQPTGDDKHTPFILTYMQLST
jgi:hypothetical protein